METVKTYTTPTTWRTRWPIACAAALALTLSVSQAQPARAEEGSDMPPNVPVNLQVPPGNQLFTVGQASGVQIYACTAMGWSFVAPSATLFDHAPVMIFHKLFQGQQIGIHSTGPTWQANDRSTVTGAKIAMANAPSGHAIPWLLLRAVITTMGAEGGNMLTDTTYIQRLNTGGGLAPMSGCDMAHVGAYAGVPYTADYFFYKAD